MLILIDNGHGIETPGKRSPDGTLVEAEWTRAIARRIVDRLYATGLDARLLVPEPDDIPLRERCRRANSSGSETLLVSVHVNAAACSGFHNASGWCAFVAPNASPASRRLARMLHDEAAARDLLGNRATPPQGYLTASLAICRDTRCPAVLTENLFMDNRDDLRRLLSDQGRRDIVDLHVEAIRKFVVTA
ncbi:MAG: N-acetylmuramoyl-L-alanine amidase [Muribaculaceae bacterium]|nr:N-acetylmuramoyl-L-alanine amidase [Muribaculaceae bacterium]